MDEKKTILYIGGFELPDKNAAAQRVVANALLFDLLGYKTVFINYSDDVKENRVTSYFGFECWEFPREKWIRAHGSVGDFNIVFNSLKDRLCAVVAYNYPALALSKIIGIAKSNNVKVLGDVTEWYSTEGMPPIKAFIKAVDVRWRMESLHKKIDGVIAISSYLRDYYSGDLPVLLLPPTVDSSSAKWSHAKCRSTSEEFSLVYAGSPAKGKERLDLIIEAVREVAAKIPVCLNIIGISEAQYLEQYGQYEDFADNVRFFGRISHQDAVDAVSSSDFSIIIRDDNRVTRAGFPTKFVESISAGTPVICNAHSDLPSYIAQRHCGVLVEPEKIAEGIMEAYSLVGVLRVDRSLFDYRNFKHECRCFFDSISI